MLLIMSLFFLVVIIEIVPVPVTVRSNASSVIDQSNTGIEG
jgi:hypothetical protein